jgi:hypothetical protein
LEKENAVNALTELNEQKEFLEECLDVLNTQKSKTEDAMKSYERRNNVDVPKLRYSFQLFSTIANIRWNFEDNTRVKGVVFNKSEGESNMETFDFAASRPTSEIVNALWEQI